ncbi:MAG: ergosterol biosynthesis protein [Saprospiraceae bacterium]|nr:ergosterol biosynthesis protein [Candidatus Opimibacter iunctus]
MNSVLGFLAPVLVYAYIFMLNAILPGRWVTGYVTRTGSSDKLKYRLNGLLTLIIVVITWGVLGYSGIMPWDWFYTNRWYGLAGAIVFGLIFSTVIVLSQPPVRKSFFADFYLGRAENLQLWGGKIDAKMWLYLVGAIMLELNVLSFAGHHHLTFGDQASPGIFLSAGLLIYFVIDYLTFEEVHLYTYDLFAERVGFKLGWGCIAFYPFFYAIPLWATADLPNPGSSTFMLVLSALIFFGSWSLSRGANLQKYYFKKDPSRSFLGIRPETISDGNKTLLVNGFWGLSRHINYLGEIGMATGIVLALGYPLLPWPWLYPLYYVALLFPRQADDDKRCALKYGPLWDQYVKKVPYRIIPYIY